MKPRAVVCGLLISGFLALMVPPEGRAGAGTSGHHSGSGAASGGHPEHSHHHSPFPCTVLPPLIVGGFVPIPYPIFVLGPPVLSAKGPPALYDPGPRIAVPPPDAERDAQAAGIDAAREGRVPDTNRASQLVTIGDRLFRANNFKKAGERYLQAARLDPYAAEPRIRLIQLAFVRGQYAEAAHQLRQVSTVQPGWLRIPFDIQSIYGEPVDFSRYIARLESHLHAHPQDRDAWLVLGAQWFLTGRKSKAADIFLRLDDPRQRPDVALAAFINNSGTQAPD